MTENIQQLAQDVIEKATAKGIRIGTAESCTGGLIGGALTDISGSSSVFDGGFLTYSNHAKHGLLGVPKQILIDHGAVSGEVAAAMASGVLKGLDGRVQLSVAVTGIAGPGGGTAEKPVGLVWFGVAQEGEAVHAEHHIFDNLDRRGVREATVAKALKLLLNRFD